MESRVGNDSHERGHALVDKTRVLYVAAVGERRWLYNFTHLRLFVRVVHVVQVDPGQDCQHI